MRIVVEALCAVRGHRWGAWREVRPIALILSSEPRPVARLVRNGLRVRICERSIAHQETSGWDLAGFDHGVVVRPVYEETA